VTLNLAELLEWEDDWPDGLMPSAQQSHQHKEHRYASLAPAAGPLAININQPGTYLRWSICYVSVANLVLIAVMVVIFGAALLLPFPKGTANRSERPAADPATGEPLTPGAISAKAGPPSDATDEDAAMWTSRARRWALRLLPPGKLLPDRQPGYVASWAYVFGVASLAALGVATPPTST
jgi:hypothetical protein